MWRYVTPDAYRLVEIAQLKGLNWIYSRLVRKRNTLLRSLRMANTGVLTAVSVRQILKVHWEQCRIRFDSKGQMFVSRRLISLLHRQCPACPTRKRTAEKG